MPKRTILGFLAAPAVIAIGVCATGLLEHSFSLPFEVVVTGIVWYFYAGAFTAIFAVPIFLVLNRFKLARWWTSTAAGLFIGGIGAMVIGRNTALGATGITLLGGLAGISFWLIAGADLLPNKSLERTQDR